MLHTKDAQIKVVQDVEQYTRLRETHLRFRRARCGFILLQVDTHVHILNGELKVVDAAIARTRARIVQSPERIKRSIPSTMSTSALEEKKAIVMHETKTRNLQV
jgi:kinetochore protein Nuf2